MICRALPLLLLLFLLPGGAGAKNGSERGRFDFGVTVGANAPFVDLHSYHVDGARRDVPAFSSRIGYQFSFFSRINIRKHFIQLQPAMVYYRTQLSLDFDQLQIAGISGEAVSYRETAHCFDLSLLYGYNFIKSGPYRLFFVVGPKLKYVFHRNSSASGVFALPVTLEEHVNRTSVALEAGLGTTISRLILSVRYELGLFQDTETFHYAYEGIAGTAKVARSLNAIYVSAGVLF